MIDEPEVVLFTSIAEYEARPNFHAELHLVADELDRIVGKYELPADRASWAVCGLNNCHREHRFGYVIRAKDARETNIGHECGKREFDVEFEEVEARYKRAVDAQARQRAITTLMDERATLITRAERAVPVAGVQGERFAAFRASFQHMAGFWTNLLKCAKQGGTIRGAHLSGGDWAASRDKGVQLVTVGVIDGAAVLLDDGSGLGAVVERDVLPWLRALEPTALAALDSAGMSETLRVAAAKRSTLERTETFATQAAALLTVENVAGMRAICDHLMKAGDADDAREVLEKWVAEARANGIPSKPVRIHRGRRG